MGRILRGIFFFAFAFFSASVLITTQKQNIKPQSSTCESSSLSVYCVSISAPAVSPPPVRDASPPVALSLTSNSFTQSLPSTTNAIISIESSDSDDSNTKTSLQTTTDTTEDIPAQLHLPAPTPFSIVWLSDTQTMTYQRYPGRMAEMGRWIHDEKEDKSIVYVVQTGDAVENGFSDWQWAEFDSCYNEFKDSLPYLPIAGNHELSIKRKDYSAYLERDYVKKIPPENAFKSGRAVFSTFNAGGIDFLLLGAGWDSELDAVAWMNEILQRYPDHVAILMFHGYIAEDARYTVVGKQMFEQVVKPNPNVRFVLCGHVCGTAYRPEDIDDTGDGIPDRRVHAMLYDYQHFQTDSGQLRLLTFDPTSRGLTVLTYSPPLDRYFRDSYFSSAEFTIDHAF